MANEGSRVVLITGACGDIGREIALSFGKAGSRLVLNDVADPGGADELVRNIGAAGSDAIYVRADVTDRAAVDRMVDEAVAHFGRLDVCIGNAGVVEAAPFLDLDEKSWRRQLDVNLTGCFHIGQAAARAMVRAKIPGRIVFVSSWVQDTPWANIAAYCVSKSGLKLLAKCMALELGRSGITVNLVAPGFVDAGLSGRAFRKDPPRKEAARKIVPLGYIASAADVASAVLAACSPGMEYMTGTTLLVDGGNSLFYRGDDSR